MNRDAGESAKLSAQLELGDTAGVLVMEDFLISSWKERTHMRPTNRLNVEPCGLQLCAPPLLAQLLYGRRPALHTTTLHFQCDSSTV